MNVLALNCPHCGTPAEISEAQIGVVLHCPNRQCGKAFRAEVPRAEVSTVPSVMTANGQPRVQLEHAEDERVVRLIHPAMRGRPLRLFAMGLLTIGGLVMALMGLLQTTVLPAEARGWMTITGLVATGTGVVGLGIWRLILQFQTLTITNERTLYEAGFIARRTSEVRHADVRNLQVHQSVGQRLMNVGDLAISSAGQEDFEIVVDTIPDPNGAAQLIRNRQ